MPAYTVLLSIPGLRRADLAQMPRLQSLVAGGDVATLTPSFPAVTCPVQANLTTGLLPQDHGVIANGFYWRDTGKLEMWTAWNDAVQEPQIWDLLRRKDPTLTSAVWFPLLIKGASADFICTPAPIHNPDGSESLWCYTKPEALYGELRDALGHFPLKHFWGPLANRNSSDWIIASYLVSARQSQPRFSYLYIPQLDYAAQKHGPDSPAAQQAVRELDEMLGKLLDELPACLPGEITWLVASEYPIHAVDQVGYPNRVLREAGLLSIDQTDDGELLNLRASRAWALADHQFAHVFVKDPADIPRVADLFASDPSVEQIWHGEALRERGLKHERSGEIVLLARPKAWFAYYYWLDDRQAPGFARTVDIHRKPGYDPVELFFDPATRSIPLDATLVKGSHGYPLPAEQQTGILISSQSGLLDQPAYRDIDVPGRVMASFGWK